MRPWDDVRVYAHSWTTSGLFSKVSEPCLGNSHVVDLYLDGHSRSSRSSFARRLRTQRLALRREWDDAARSVSDGDHFSTSSFRGNRATRPSPVARETSSQYSDSSKTKTIFVLACTHCTALLYLLYSHNSYSK